MRHTKKLDLLIMRTGIGLFLVAIFVPLIVALSEPDSSYSNTEKRPLAPLPSLPESTQDWQELPTKLNAYYADQFGLRDWLNSRYLHLMSMVAPDAPLTNVTRGQDGWLFFGSPKPHLRGKTNPFGDARHTDLYSDSDLAIAATRIKQRSDWLRAQGIEYLYTIAPNKHTIYFDKLPKHITKAGPISSTDQLLGYLRANTDVTVVDLRPGLFEKRQEADIYYQYDTHWNFLGANIAQFEIMREVNTLLPDSVPARRLPDSLFDFRELSIHGDLSTMAQIENPTEIHPLPEFKGECLPIDRSSALDRSERRMITTCNHARLNALVYRDSFGNALVEYFSRQFEIATFVWRRTNYESLQTELAIRKPDIVIEQVTERFLPYIPDGDRPPSDP